MRPFRCVKCGEGHKTADCPKKDRNTPAKCALCSCDHPANYKGCQVYREILARKTINKPSTDPKLSRSNAIKRDFPKPVNTEFTLTRDGFPELMNKRQPLSRATIPEEKSTDLPKTGKDSTYHYTGHDNALWYSNNNPQPNLNYPKLERILINQSEKIDCLIQQIGTMLNLLTTVIAKLS